MALAGQTFNPTTARYLRKADGKEQFVSIEKVTPIQPYNKDGTFENPYDGDWISTLASDLDWNFKMRSGCIEIYATKGMNFSLLSNLSIRTADI